jgi:predicted SAM-dependent methyltransferase
MHEQSKSAKRRFYDGNFISKYFVGNGIDIGCGPDSVGQYATQFPLISSVKPWDMPDGDAQYLKSIADETFDFVHSSHCLEHMVDVNEALSNWIRVTKVGGYLIITVPDEDMYEHGIWPSVNNSDHKHSFTISKHTKTMPASINVIDLVKSVADKIQVQRITLLDDFHRPGLPANLDQTLTPNAECAIEFVLMRIK